MNKREVAEIKRRFKKESATFTRVGGCYVGCNHNKVCKIGNTFLNLEEDEFYIADILGAMVYTEDGKEFGKLKDVLETGANLVYVVEHEGKEVLLPAIPDCVKDVDVEEKKLIVHILPGLLD